MQGMLAHTMSQGPGRSSAVRSSTDRQIVGLKAGMLSTETTSHPARVRTFPKLFVPQKYIGKPFDELFEGLLREQGAVALALYRATHREDNDNVLPYVYTCPQRETTLNESDGVLVLMPPKQSGNVLTSSDDEDVEQKKTIRLSFSSEMMTPLSVQKAQPATTHHRKEKRQKKEKKSKKAKKAKKKRSSERSIEDVKIDVVEREEETKDPKNSSDEDFTF